MECTSITDDFLCLFEIVLEEIDISEFLVETIVISILGQCLKCCITRLDILVLLFEEFYRLYDSLNWM
jgi:hypothetical protein